MEGAQMNTRGDSRFADYEDDYGDASGPKTGTKRLYSNRNPRFEDSDDYGEGYDVEAEEAAQHSVKRYRSRDWPLASTNNANTTPRARRVSQGRNTPASSPPVFPSSQAYPSRFIEGSMNDRVSQKPPPPYLGDEEHRERYYQEEQSGERKIAQPRRPALRISRTSSHSDKPESARNSGIFRFSKSIAATFNPVNWKIWSKPQEEITETPEQKVLRERRDRAESIYLELKRNGQFRDSAVPPFFNKVEEVAAKHDSGIGLVGPVRTSTDSHRPEKRNGMVFLDPPPFDALHGSPGSNVSGSVAGSTRKSSFNFRKPSLPSMRKVSDSDGGLHDAYSGRVARRIPSRKDLQKQQKLVKRVSDLEMRLETARRQLSDALGEPLPTLITPLPAAPMPRIGKPRFVPGALATLPSERLLAGNVSADDREGEEGPVQSKSSRRTDRTSTKEKSTKNAASNEIDMASASLAEKVEASQMNSGDLTFGGVEVMSEQVTDHSTKGRSVRASTQATETTQATTVSEASTVVYNPKESTSDEDEQVQDTIEEDLSEVDLITSKSPSISKNRFARVFDKSSAYNPDQEGESEEDSEDEGIITPKSSVVAHSQKLQKPAAILKNGSKVLSHKVRPVKKASSPLSHRPSASRPRQQPNTKVTSQTGLATIPRQPSKLQKNQYNASRSSKAKQALSSPPSSFASLELNKPSLQPPVQPNTYSGTHNTYTPDSDVPPVPPLPAAVRLASGEIINTATARVQPQAAKLTKLKARRAVKESASPKGKDGMKRDKSFEWPPDVF